MSKIDLIVSNVINSVNSFLGEHHNESLTDAQKDNLRRFVEAQDALTVFREEVEKDYIERASLETLYEQIRDMRDGYCDGDMPGAIEKLYNQITDMMGGN